MSKRRKLLLLLALLILLPLVLVHTQPVERLILREVARRLPPGYVLEAERLDLNLFRLSARLRGVRLDGPPVTATLEEVYVNAGRGVLSGRIDLDALRVAQGEVLLKPMPPGEKTEGGPLELPPIHLGKAELAGVSVRYADTATALDVALEDLHFDYVGQRLTLGFKTPAQTAVGRELPPMVLDLSGDTADFQTLTDLSVKLAGPQSRLVVTGSAGLTHAPELDFDLAVHRDLLPELPGVTVVGGLHGGIAKAVVTAPLPLGEETRKLEITTEFDAMETPRKIPLRLTLEELLRGDVDLVLEDDGLTGTYRLTGDPAAVAALHPLLQDLEGAVVHGNLAVPFSGTPAAEARLEVTGMPEMAVDVTYRNGAVRFSGSGAPLPAAHLRFSGDYGPRGVQVALDGLLPHLDGLPGLDIPEALCAGPIAVSGHVSSDLTNWTVDDLRLELAKVAYEPYIDDQMVVTLSGDNHALRGAVFSSRLNPVEAPVRFVLDLDARRWQSLSLFINAGDMYVDETRRADVMLRAEGSGALDAPDLSGYAAVDVLQESLLGRLRLPFVLKGRELDLPRIDLTTAHGALAGHASVLLTDTPTYGVDLAFTMAEDPEFQPLVEGRLPHGLLTLNGNQDALRAGVLIPRQNVALEGMELDLTSDIRLSLDIAPPTVDISGEASDWTVAGVAVSDLLVDKTGDRLDLSLHLRSVDTDALRTALGDYWPDDLMAANLDGELTLHTDTSFQNPELDLRLGWLEGSFCKGTFWAKNARIRYGESLLIDPFKAHFAGIDLTVSSADATRDWPKKAGGDDPESDDLGVKVAFSLVEGAGLAEFMQVPDIFLPETATGTVVAFSDRQFSQPRAALTGLKLDAVYEGHAVTIDNLEASYDGGIWAEGVGRVDGLNFSIEAIEDGFRLNAKPNSTDIETWVEGFAGGAEFDASLTWHNRADGAFLAELLVVQEGSALVYLDPYMAFTDMHLALTYDSVAGLKIQDSGGKVNGGTLSFSGTVVPQEEMPDIDLSLVANEVDLNLVDLRLKLSTAVEWEASAQKNVLRATAYVDDGYYAPRQELKALVQDLITAVPELYFPDPFLENIKLEAFVATTAPLIVETDVAYLEVEAPWLILGGSLAEPRPVEGYVVIDKGSSLDLNNQSFVFHDSQVQFIRNRPDDPYLLVSLESAEDVNKNTINLTGFVSELGKNVDTQNLTNILVNYLLGEFSTMVSLEPGQGKTLFDDSFTFVVSKSLTRKLVTRYAIPLNEPKSKQRVELSVGPYRNNFLNLANQDEVVRGDLQHSRKFGYPEGKRPPRIRKIQWPDDVPKWVRKSFLLKREQFYSETLWRRARLDLERRLREKGYLQPTLSHTWDGRTVALDFSFGPRTNLAVEGLSLSNADRARLFRAVPGLDDEGIRILEGEVERLALAKGYPSASASARLDDATLRVRVLVSQPLGDLKISFGEADKLLAQHYTERKARQEFMQEYLLSADRARGRLRARLAAKGYLAPEMGQGTFEDFEHFVMPIDPGRRAVVLSVVENGEKVSSPFTGRKFDSGLLAQVAGEMQLEAGRKALVRVRPRQEGPDVVLDVERTPLEETLIESLMVTGTDRVGEETIKRYMAFEPGMKQQDLIDAQKDLIEAGPFSSVRLKAERDATLEVLERNRWDADYLVSWDERDDFGHALQFQDYMLFHGFNTLGARMERTKVAEEFLGRLKFDRVWGTKLDITLGYKWRNQKTDPSPNTVTLVDDFFDETYTITTKTLAKSAEPSIEFSYPLTKHQEVNLGADFNRTHTSINVVDSRDGFEFTSNFLNISVPVRLTWVYRRLDYPVNPRNGILATASVDYFTDQGANSVYDGLRYKTSLATFKTWEKARLMWSNRMESGIFADSHLYEDTADPGNTQLFLLGGSTTVRGYSEDLLGPLNIFFSDDETVTVGPKGGKAMFFTSQELTYTTSYFGLGFTPFVDAGWVWEDYGELFQTGLVVSGGLGISLDTPVGYFRLDWARPLDDRPLQNLLDDAGFDAEERKLFRDVQETSWYFRFGRVF